MPRSNYVVLAKLQIRYELNYKRKRALMRKYPETWTTHPHFIYLCKQEEKINKKCVTLRNDLRIRVADTCGSKPCANNCKLSGEAYLGVRDDKKRKECPDGLNPFKKDRMENYQDVNVLDRAFFERLEKLVRIKEKLLRERPMYDSIVNGV